MSQRATSYFKYLCDLLPSMPVTDGQSTVLRLDGGASKAMEMNGREGESA